MNFSLKKHKVKLQPSETRTLAIMVEVDTTKLLDADRVDQDNLKQPQTKLLVARLKNSKVLFSFFLVINIVDDDFMEEIEF